MASMKGGRLWWGGGMEEEFCGGGKGRFCMLGTDDVMMMGVVL